MSGWTCVASRDIVALCRIFFQIVPRIGGTIDELGAKITLAKWPTETSHTDLDYGGTSSSGRTCGKTSSSKSKYQR